MKFLIKKRLGFFFVLAWSLGFQVDAQHYTANFARDALYLPVRPAITAGSTKQDTLALERFRIKPLLVPAGLAVSGLVVQGKISRQLQQQVVGTYPDFHTKADDYLLFAPAALSLSLGAAGVKGKHPFGEQVLLAVLSGLAQGGVTYILKGVSKYPRPDGTTNDAFPSGHTSSAFASATLLHKEYGHRSMWYSVGGYGVATGVGAMRILNNRHWLADVLFGAGVGIGATEVVYMGYPWVKKKLQRKSKVK
jgi:membrane-associated phospholipid phosphatase